MIDFGLGIQLKIINPNSPLEMNQTHAWRNDPKIWRWTRQNDLLSYASHEKWLAKQESEYRVKMYKLMHGSSWIGVGGLTDIDMQNSRAEFSLYIGPEHQRNGYARPALKTLFYHGFKNMGLNSIWGETFADNPAQKVFRDLGMHEDGLRRQFYYKDGKYCDAILFSVLSTEFLGNHGERSCFGLA